MNLTPTEQERLTIFTAAQLAREHRKRGIALSHPEAIAYICDELLYGARQGKSLKEMMGLGSQLLTTDDVLPGVAELIPVVHVEAMFPDGTKLVTVHEPIRAGAKPQPVRVQAGEVVTPDGDIEINAGRRTLTLKATNSGDRPVQVGSHFHFFEANKALDFDRAASFGMRLDIPSGTAVRFEPGQALEVNLVEVGGRRSVSGFNSLTEGSIDSDDIKQAALTRAREQGFRGA
ncbi:MAG: urease subunit beta [Alphaproteobacteria bacterium]|jgi:urease subunit gamma/beta|nr:urease subunit beta [Alphaproteobacteria bacterium]MDP6588279.1 urease subunit beta [Alphaproteobacteria bacterium]MDP6817707.1 urease subunit beta [Alphaproteobacteria bacterium]